VVHERGEEYEGRGRITAQEGEKGRGIIEKRRLGKGENKKRKSQGIKEEEMKVIERDEEKENRGKKNKKRM
jgi:hypothetical protein